MGTAFIRLLERLTEFPIKNRPVSYHLQRNFTSTGEEQPAASEAQKTDAYDQLLAAFVAELKLAKVRNNEWFDETFFLWDKLTINGLNNTYSLLASETNGMLDFTHLYYVRHSRQINFFTLYFSCWLLESVGDTSSRETRLQKFEIVDINQDGYINFDEFLILVYTYDGFHETEGLKGLARQCYEASQKIEDLMELPISDHVKCDLL